MTTNISNEIDCSRFQSTALIGKQAPIPTGIHDIELSWDREADFMRIFIDNKKWYFKEYSGKAVVLSTDDCIFVLPLGLLEIHLLWLDLLMLNRIQ